jgi:hypothetical protein
MRKLYFVGTIIILLFGEMNVGLFAQNVRYVKPVAEGTSDGSSWSNASSDLSAILAVSAFNDEVWIAAGTYTPGDGSSRSASFIIPSGIRLYGGFAGNETSIIERDAEINKTIFSGNIGIVDVLSDNINHIITIDNSFNNILDGFIIQNAYSNSSLFISEPASISRAYSFLPAADFGAMNFSVTGEVQLAEPLDACTAAGDLTGKIALIQRGTCTFVSKTLAAQNAGAIAVIIFNNVEGAIPFMGGGPDSNIVIPVVAISLPDGILIQNELISGNSVIVNLESGQDGGGMNILSSNTTITNCTFQENSAIHGSAIYAYDSYLDITNCQFLKNSSSYGSIFDYESALNLRQCSFIDNYSGNGGGVYGSFSDNIITHCQFDSNKVSTSAGAIYSYMGESMVDSCSFTANRAQFGGSIRGSGDSSTLLLINHCYFKNNEVTGGGASMIFTLGKASVNSCFIYDNKAFSEDSTAGTGGGVQIQQEAQVEINNSVIANNQALGKEDDGGGAIMIYGGQLMLNNVTIVNNNSASWGGAIRIYDSSGAVLVNNSILWNNTSLEDSTDCIYNTGGIYSINYSDIQDENQMEGPGNLNENPEFFDGLNPLGADNIAMTIDDGLMLQTGSPLIASGINLVTSLYDILGNIQSDPPSIGAYGTVVFNYIPVIDNILYIYPNPSTGIINLSGNEGITNIIISNIVGQVMWTGKYESFPLDISNWKTGIYIIRFEAMGKVVTQKLIKE